MASSRLSRSSARYDSIPVVEKIPGVEGLAKVTALSALRSHAVCGVFVMEKALPYVLPHGFERRSDLRVGFGIAERADLTLCRVLHHGLERGSGEAIRANEQAVPSAGHKPALRGHHIEMLLVAHPVALSDRRGPRPRSRPLPCLTPIG